MGSIPIVGSNERSERVYVEPTPVKCKRHVGIGKARVPKPALLRPMSVGRMPQWALALSAATDGSVAAAAPPAR